MRLRYAALLLLMAVLAIIVGCGKPPSEDSNNTDTSSKSSSSSGGLFSRSPTVTVPEGTSIFVRLDPAISSKNKHSRDTFSATWGPPGSVGGKDVISEGADPTRSLVHGQAPC